MSFSYRHDSDEPSYTYKITGVAISNKSIVVISTIGFGLLGFIIYFLILRQTTGDDAEEQEKARRNGHGEMLNHSDVATLNRAQRRARAKFRMKKARRAVVPAHQVAEGVNGGGGGVRGDEGGDGGGDIDLAEFNNLSRKERQRAAKAMEQKERKVYAEEARKWRENNTQSQSTRKSGEGYQSDGGKEKKKDCPIEESKLSPGDMSPRRPSEFLFWESIARNMEEEANSNCDEKISDAHPRPKMTIRQFIERLKENGSVSIAALADEFGVSINQALIELENINKQHGLVGVVDTKGNFVYVSAEMIKLAMKLGRDAGRVLLPP